MFKFMKYRKEYWHELVRMPYFWIGITLTILAIVLLLLKIIGYLLFIITFIAGYIFVISCKYRILGRLEERHFNKK